MFACLAINVILNFYWSALIIRAAYRIVFTRKDETDFNGDVIKEEKEGELEMTSESKAVHQEGKLILDPEQPQSDL